MDLRFRVLAAAAFLTISATAGAQSGRTPADRPAKRELTEEQRQRLEQHKQQIEERRDQLKAQRDQAVGQRRELMEQLREFQRQLREQLGAGTVTKDRAVEQMKAWRESHKPEKPAKPVKADRKKPDGTT